MVDELGRACPERPLDEWRKEEEEKEENGQRISRVGVYKKEHDRVLRGQNELTFSNIFVKDLVCDNTQTTTVASSDAVHNGEAKLVGANVSLGNNLRDRNRWFQRNRISQTKVK